MSGVGVGGDEEIKYIYQLPFQVRKEICRIFDENNQWEELGGSLMGYKSGELHEFGRANYRGASPTDALLTSWGNQNHTILELFTLFAKIYHGRGMGILAKFVDEKYHNFIQQDFNATQLLETIPKPQAPQPLRLRPSPGGAGAGTGTAGAGAVLAGVGKKDGPLAKSASIAKTLAESVGLLPQIPYVELTAATCGWDRRNVLGKGGFGTVYKGLWKSTPVAIKRMEQRTNDAYVESQLKQSLGEMKFLNTYRHDNILPLYGFSLEGAHPCLVYQYMMNGSLEDRILCRQKAPPLTWYLRLQIAKGVACGIQFLHSIGPHPLIHGDIKSANILLDRNFEPKVGDFGLAREMSVGVGGSDAAAASYVRVSRVHGTRPYLPDEYLRSKKLSTKVDTYSFGVVLYELATGLRAYEETRQRKMLKELVEEFDGMLEKLKDGKGGPDYPEFFFILMNLGKICTERLAKKRPEMVEVLKSLENAMHNVTASSIRTFSTHVTGLPNLFELPLSRPGSLGIPLSSYTTNRNSPEMRAGSPHWTPHHPAQQGPPNNPQNTQGLPSPNIPSPGGVRKISETPLPFAPLPLPMNLNFAALQVPVQLPQNIQPELPQQNQSNSNNSSTSNNNSLPPLTIDTRQHPQLPIPELHLIQASPVPLQNCIVPQGEGTLMLTPKPAVAAAPPPAALLLPDDTYLPLVLDEHNNNSDPTSASASASASASVVEDGPATVIPLITALGIKDEMENS